MNKRNRYHISTQNEESPRSEIGAQVEKKEKHMSYGKKWCSLLFSDKKNSRLSGWLCLLLVGLTQRNSQHFQSSTR